MIFFKVAALLIICVAIWFTIRFFVTAYDKGTGVEEHQPGK